MNGTSSQILVRPPLHERVCVRHIVWSLLFPSRHSFCMLQLLPQDIFIHLRRSLRIRLIDLFLSFVAR